MQETQNVFEHDSAHESGEEEDQEYDDSSSQNSQEQVKNTMIRESLHYTKLHSVRNREDTHVRKQLQAYIDVEDDEAAFDELEQNENAVQAKEED